MKIRNEQQAMPSDDVPDLDERFATCESHLQSIRRVLMGDTLNKLPSRCDDALCMIDLAIIDVIELCELLVQNRMMHDNTGINDELIREIQACRARGNTAEGHQEQNIHRMCRLIESLLNHMRKAYMTSETARRKERKRICCRAILIVALLCSPFFAVGISSWYSRRHLEKSIRTNLDCSQAESKYAESDLQEVRDLWKVSRALRAYYLDNNIYPMSSTGGERWDGLHSVWGEARTDWIKNLVPEYITELPRDPRNSDKPEYNYIYRSDRFGYKLGIMKPREEIRDVLKEKYPEMKDVGKGYISYGIWTERAREW